MDKMATLLVVDDDDGVLRYFNAALKDKYHLLLAETGKQAIDIFTKNTVDVILLDILLPDIDGIDLLKKLKEIEPKTEIVMVTAVDEIQTAVKAIKLGAYEYITKPQLNLDEMTNIINRALEKRRLEKEVAYLKKELERYNPFEKIVAQDRKMRDIFDLISIIRDSNGAVLIQGESGTGKELIARAIHNATRKDHPFVVINCAAIPATLMESEIFGYNKGAFTGATDTTTGKLEIANKGTVFLDDIDCLDISLQAKLLRILQEKEFQRLGGTKIIKVDARFVAASNKDLNELMARGEFREDLFYRLNVFPIVLPPLRNRRSDIPLLLNHFLELHTKKTGKAHKRFSEKAIDILTRYNWPGNVRELENLVERLATITKRDVIDIQDMSSFRIGLRQVKGMKLKDAVSAFEKKYINEVLADVDGSRKKASEILGIHRNTLLGKISE